jgi:putative transposase
LRGGDRRPLAAESALSPFKMSYPECQMQAVSSARETGLSGAMTRTDYSGRVQMKRAYKFRAYPTRPQEGRAAHLLADHCDLYNAALEERREAWRRHSASVSYGTQSAQLGAIRAADPHGQGRHSFTAQQQTLRRLDVVFRTFYARAQAGGAGYPRFKAYSRFHQVLFVAGDGARWEPAVGRWAYARFRAVGSVKVRQHRPVAGAVKTLQLKREQRRWYVIVVTDCEPVPLPATGRKVGVDVGVARFLTTSAGDVIANPRFLVNAQDVIAELQRRMERARRGSGNRKRIRRQLAREWRKVRSRRRDFHHKTARTLVSEFDVIALEKLNTWAMTHRPAPRLDDAGAWLPNGAAAKAGLNKVILDAGWAQFTTILTGKAEEAGRRVVLVNPARTSTDCHQCGARCHRPRQNLVICPEHGGMDADINAAHNIATRAGLGSGHAYTA